MKEKSFTLCDPRINQREAPYTFFLPHPKRLEAIGVGDFVKLIFQSTQQGTKYGAERMWVEVTGVQDGVFSGKLDNEPTDMPGLELGEDISFRAWHVISIDFADEKKGKRLSFPQREYFNRCLVDRCVMDGEKLVHYVYREEPDMGQDDDTHPDGGWRIRGDWRGISDEEVDERELAYVALGAVLNRDDSWLGLIDSPAGSAFIRDWDKNLFVPEDS